MDLTSKNQKDKFLKLSKHIPNFEINYVLKFQTKHHLKNMQPYVLLEFKIYLQY